MRKLKDTKRNEVSTALDLTKKDRRQSDKSTVLDNLEGLAEKS